MNNWHALETNELSDRLNTNAKHGLSADEASRRLIAKGPNELPAAKRRSAVVRLLMQFNSPLIYILMVAAVVTFLLEDYLDTWVIAAVVVINATIGFVQEGRAEKALDSVRGLMAEMSQVIRDGRQYQVNARELVVGDLIQLESGAKVPADARIVACSNFQVAEALLTGESIPIEKTASAQLSTADLADRRSMIYAGTLVAAGVATAIVTATGAQTELGKIGKLVEEVGSLKTPLTRRLDRFAGQITAVILVVGAAIFGYGYLRLDMQLAELFITSVSLVVAAVPEGLPAIVTIVLAIGTGAMSRQKALIRRLPAVETLGSVSIIWSDKTGTLTQNEMTVASFVTSSVSGTVSGVGYRPIGSLEASTDSEGARESIAALATAARLCNRSEVREEVDGVFVAVGDPTEAALLVFADKAGFTAAHAAHQTLLDVIPFESERRFMATLHAGEESNQIWLKGAPERVFELVSATLGGGAFDAQEWHAKANALAAQGQRVLALAGMPTTSIRFHNHELANLELIGLVGVIDPPREAAKAAIATCQQAGIVVKMITGDHLVTAAAIGEQLGLNVGVPLGGPEIDSLDDLQLTARMKQTDIVARATPEHKLRLVRLAQSAGYQVAMTGDGVNDAPALQAADIGIAMGLKGTDAARSASDLVLTDDRFETIEGAVERGRVVFDNIKKSMLHILPTNAGEVLILTVAILAGWILPVTASQILWVNLVCAVTVSLALVAERAEADLMQRPPRDSRQPLLTTGFVMRTLFIGLLIAVTTLLVFEAVLAAGASLEEARGAAVTMVVVAEMFYLFNVRRFVDSGLNWRNFTTNRLALITSGILMALQLLFLYTPQLNSLFKVAPIDLATWGMILGLGFAMFLLVELEKAILRTRGVSAF